MNRIATGLCILGLVGALAGVAATQSASVPASRVVVPSANLSVGVMSACYLPGTDVKIIEMVEGAVNAHREKWNAQRQEDYNANDRWSGVPQGSPVTLRWSLANDGIFIPSGVGENGGNNIINARLPVIFGSHENGLNLIRQCFDRWEALTGIEYIEVADSGHAWNVSGPHNGGPASADIRIGMKSFGFGGVLAYNFFPDGGDMVLNNNESGFFAQSGANHRAFRNVVTHENGHGIGLFHVCPTNRTKLMEPFIFTNRDMVQHDDLRGGQRNYGDRFEDNNFAGQSTDLGTISTFQIQNDLSLDGSGDTDYYRVNVDPGKQMTVRVTPIGFTYQDWDQLQNGNCANSGPTVDSLRIMDLQLTIRNEGGGNILINQDDSDIGAAEVITDFVLPGGGEYFVQVHRDAFTTNAVQLYNLRIDIEDAVNSQATLLDFNVILGTLLNGDLQSLVDSDDSTMDINSNFGFNSSEPNLFHLQVNALSPENTPSSIDVTVESRMSQNGGIGKLFLRNWTTTVFDQVAQFARGASEQVHVQAGLSDVYVRASDGRVETQLKHVAVIVFSSNGFDSFIDQIKIEANQ